MYQSCAKAILRLSTFSFSKRLTLVPLSSQRMSSAGNAGLEVEHDTKRNEFYIQLKKGEKIKKSKAFLQYSYIRPDYVDLEHTVVPVEFQGHGVAKVLAQAAFDHFVERRIDMRPTCTYLQKFYQENPLAQYQERVKWEKSSI